MRQTIRNGQLDFNKNFLSHNKAWSIFDELFQNTPWTQGNIKLFGKEIAIPRKEAFYHLDGKTYSYSGKRLESLPFPPVLFELLEKIEAFSGHSFNSVLINLYRNGKDSNGWHADNEPELGINPVIASLSLGAERNFDLKHISTGEKIRISLNHGSLLVMSGAIQHFWKHQLAKSSKVNEPRINLTFRKIN